MSPKRGDRVAPPPGPDEWDIRFRDNDAARGWEELCNQAPDNTLDAWARLRRNPLPIVQSPRQHCLRGKLGRGSVKGRSLDRWQIEVTRAARIWYMADSETTTVWIDEAGPGHPKATE
ncbi:MAG TPA: hypothetical protein VMI73_17125 [Trebonia sp.]|nr:hypothetical protein [Trebonia sp.]